MGANAQTSVPTFVAGEILTAANMNISARTGIPVFADSTARDAAFGGAGEKTLAEGQFAYLESTNALQYYDGAAWQASGASSGLTFITGTTFSAVTSVSLPANTFSATYDNYRCYFEYTDSTALTVTMRLRAAGADLTTANYSTAFTGLGSDGTAINKNGSAQTSSTITNTGGFGNQNFINLDIYNPNLVKQTSINGQALCQTGSNVAVLSGGGLYGATTAADSLSIIASTGTITGKYRIYGYANS